ncbi:hypothetical protein BHE74_00030354 [Ensete ventricosum]|nr:hypothetical protein BHE74_00030354 [Ensete ventricosum]
MSSGEGMGDGSLSKKQIILVHGVCHGAWCWHKVTTLLMSAGYQVTVPDLAASGVDERRFEDLRTFTDYSQPLLDILACVPPGERVILVGHSLGGLNIALAMDRFPEKIAAAVFVTAFMPDSVNPPSYVLDKVLLPSSGFLEDLASMPPFSEPGYGSVEKIYVVCAQDEIIREGFQRWMIENNPVKEVTVLEDADHMPMFSTLKQLFQCLSHVADACT